MVLLANLLWDAAALVVSLVALVYIRKLERMFRGGTYGKAYRYYYSAMVVLVVAFSLRVVLDYFDINPIVYGLSVRNPAIIVSILLLILGFRSSAKFWSISKSG